jgi:hypothetical protein
MILTAGTRCNAAPESSSPSVIRVALVGGRPVVSGVYLNGHGPYRFLLDTGAQTNRVDTGIARRLRLTATFQVAVLTVNGATKATGTRIAEIQLGSARAADQELLFSKLEAVHQMSLGIQGVLGQEFLSRFDYLLDLRAKTIAFDVPVPAGERIPAKRVDGVLAIATSAGLLGLDSGSDALVLFHSKAGGLGPAATIRSAAAVATARDLSGMKIRIGDRDYKPKQASAVANTDLKEDGILPVSVFKSVYVSNSGSYLIADPN